MDYNLKRKTVLIGSRILQLRKEIGWTQHKLAKKIAEHSDREIDEFHQTTISIWEQGNALPLLKYLVIMADLFDCDIGYLLGDYDTKRKDTSNICAVTGLSKETVEMLSELSNTDKERLKMCDDNAPGSYFEAVRHHLFMPTFNLLIGHPEFRPFMSMLIEFLIDRDAPINSGGPVDPEEYAQGKRTIEAGEHSELCFYRATQTLHRILTDVSMGYDKEIARWKNFFEQEKTAPSK